MSDNMIAKAGNSAICFLENFELTVEKRQHQHSQLVQMDFYNKCYKNFKFCSVTIFDFYKMSIALNKNCFLQHF